MRPLHESSLGPLNAMYPTNPVAEAWLRGGGKVQGFRQELTAWAAARNLLDDVVFDVIWVNGQAHDVICIPSVRPAELTEAEIRQLEGVE